LGCRQGVLPKTFEHMTDERRCMAMPKLLMLFRAGRIRAEGTPTASLFVGPRYARTSSKTGCRGEESSPAEEFIPVLLTTKLVLFCSPRDRIIAETRNSKTSSSVPPFRPLVSSTPR
jgi:hypothetical protein